MQNNYKAGFVLSRTIVFIFLISPWFSWGQQVGSGNNLGKFSDNLSSNLSDNFSDSIRWLQDIRTLTSPSLHGRGYSFNGVNVAADFLADEFKQIGLSPMGEKGTYFQPFQHSVVAFEGAMDLTIGKRDLRVGVEWLPSAGCPSVKGRFKVVGYDSSVWIKDIGPWRGKAVLLPMGEEKKVIASLKRLGQNARSVKDLEKVLFIFQKSGKLTHTIGEDLQNFRSIICLKELDIKVGERLTIELESREYPNFESKNVLGVLRGKVVPDSFIAITAHYDHLGNLGTKVYVPGANDNASGTAMVLALARYFANAQNNRYSILFMAFAGEEAGLLGSLKYVATPILPLQRLAFVLNLDLAGFGEKGVTVVNATEFPKQFSTLVEVNNQAKYLAEVRSRGPSANSDHYPFYMKGIPSFFVYAMGGSSAYHDPLDRAENIDGKSFRNYFEWLKNSVKALGF